MKRALAGGVLMMTVAVAGEGVQATETAPAMRTVCLGRYLVDVPVEAVYQGQIAYFQSWLIKVEEKTEERFQADYTAFVAKQKAERHSRHENLLRKEIEKDHNSRAVFYFPTSITADSYDIQAHFWRDGRAFVFSDGGTVEKEALASIDVDNLLNRFRSRRVDDVPLEQGFCFEGGFVADEANGFRRESVSYSFRWNDIDFELSSMPKFKEDEPSLLKRVDDYEIPESMKSRWEMVKTLRRGKRRTDYVKGEELLQTYPANDGGRYHSFVFESDSKLRDLLAPAITINMESGWKPERREHTNSSMSERELIKLFDQMVNSIRLRPTTHLPAATQSGHGASEGVQVRSGERAPHTGRYRHAREGALTPAILHIQQGQRLPPVELKDPRGLMDRLRGKPAVLAEDVVWEWLPDVPESGPSPN